MSIALLIKSIITDFQFCPSNRNPFRSADFYTITYSDKIQNKWIEHIFGPLRKH